MGHGSWIERQWYGVTPWHAVLLPVSVVFRLISAVRRLSYRLGLLKVIRVAVPVVVVGNISVGGTGKTPLTIWLAHFLTSRGHRPGIVSRGYGGSGAEPRPVTPASDPGVAGDEPVLLARRAGVPVWVCRDRPAAAVALLRAHPECDVLIADDGLQHYRLGRDVEIAVVDGRRLFGNGFLLPAGPLRESIRRLDAVDATVYNGGEAQPDGFAMRLAGERFYNMHDPQRWMSAGDLRGKRLLAVAGIGDPRRFFDRLRGWTLDIVERPFPDHHAFAPDDLRAEGVDAVVMTEKDAVKCRAFAPANCWVLQVDAELDDRLGDLVVQRIEAARRRRGA